MPDLHPMHASLYRGARRVASVRPLNMDRVQMPDSLRTGLTDIALKIFTDCTNVGVPFQDALLAIYLSGLQHGAAINQENP